MLLKVLHFLKQKVFSTQVIFLEILSFITNMYDYCFLWFWLFSTWTFILFDWKQRWGFLTWWRSLKTLFCWRTTIRFAHGVFLCSSRERFLSGHPSANIILDDRVFDCELSRFGLPFWILLMRRCPDSASIYCKVYNSWSQC